MKRHQTVVNKTDQSIRYLNIDLATAPESKAVRLTSGAANLEAVHIFDEDSVYAVNAALASGRPLLVRGEPGVGKSQLAQAVAEKLNRVFLPFAVDIQTEAKDLLWRLDSIERLAKAQIAGTLTLPSAQSASKGGASEQDKTLHAQLALSKFLHPGPLWWAFDWDDAMRQVPEAQCCKPSFKEGTEKNGCVVLIDEIDKAETDVPNGLLEALGAGQFKIPGRSETVCATPPYPLVVITTNEERALPDAFLRRCMVLNLEFPGEKALVERGKQHFSTVERAVREKAAVMLVDDREKARKGGLRPLPGQAEYLDLLRALDQLHRGEPERQTQLLDKIRKFALCKHGADLRQNDDE